MQHLTMPGSNADVYVSGSNDYIYVPGSNDDVYVPGSNDDVYVPGSYDDICKTLADVCISSEQIGPSSNVFK